MSVYFYSANPCATCAPNGILLAQARKVGLDYEFKFAAGVNADIAAAYKNGVNLPFFTDGEIFAQTAADFQDMAAEAAVGAAADALAAQSAAKPAKSAKRKTAQPAPENANEAVSDGEAK